ncbi:protoporphyrinogen oxidase [Microlunatus parietis]|uniref:Coproporphyrinogen III oxidase n=1 Tax=Microlunatus parietis TaxID=682979 RepID=A0A7Y9I2P3_9ACTN|nr:protoporphyrinogen oxidase [Microlunatus parietis]NYE68839.1 oxygen-dependent protoporphyrinogen oxidase [Microlunatus parietis]
MNGRVVVVGGGVAGLTAARALAGAGRSVLVLEAAPRLGGKIISVAPDGVSLDGGAESLLARRPEAVRLVAELGLPIVHPTGASSKLLIKGRLQPLPRQAMGIPVDLDGLAELLEPDDLARARREPELPAPALAGDIGIGAYVDARFGPAVTDRLLEPMLGGVYAGRARELSFEAVNRALYERARAGGSLLGHAADLVAAGSGVAGGPVFAGLPGGVSGLLPALVADLERSGVELRTGATVRDLERAGSGYRLTVGAATTSPLALRRAQGAEVLQADSVVLAVPAAPLSRLLDGLAGPVVEEVARVPYASMAVVTLVVRGFTGDGSGALVPPGELPTIKAFTHSSFKWDWVADAARAAWGAGAAVIRASVGRIGEERLLQLDDERLAARTYAEARDLVPGWAGTELITHAVTRFGGGLPQYLVGHVDLVRRLRAAVGAQPGLAVCGALLDGVGIAACIGSGLAAAETIMNDRSSTGTRA